MLKVDFSKAFDSVDRRMLLDRLRQKLGNTEECRVWEGLLTSTNVILSGPWGQSTFESNKGIRQGAVESPMFFAALTEWIMEDTIEKHAWNQSVSTYPDLHITQAAYMDDVLIWDGTTTGLQSRAKQLADTFAAWGLRVNMTKSCLYTSPKHIQIDGTTLTPSPTLPVMGVRAPSRHMAKCQEEILREQAPSLLVNTIGRENADAGAILWNSAAFFPEPLLFQFTMWTLRPKKANDEPWPEYRMRTVRQARQIVLKYFPDRWSTQWLARFWGCGHVARGQHDPCTSAACILSCYRPKEWWEHHQNLSQGHRHSGRFFPNLHLWTDASTVHAKGYGGKLHATGTHGRVIVKPGFYNKTCSGPLGISLH